MTKQARAVFLDPEVLGHEVYKDAERFRVFVYLLVNAHATNRKYEAWRQGQKIPLKRGQLVTSIDEIATDLGISQKVVRVRLNTLDEGKLGVIKRKKLGGRVGTLITIHNFSKYQDLENYGWPKGRSSGQAKGQASGQAPLNNTENNSENNKGAAPWACELANSIAKHAQSITGKATSKASIKTWAERAEDLAKRHEFGPQGVTKVLKWAMRDLRKNGGFPGWKDQIRSVPDPRKDKFEKIVASYVSENGKLAMAKKAVDTSSIKVTDANRSKFMNTPRGDREKVLLALDLTPKDLPKGSYSRWFTLKGEDPSDTHDVDECLRVILAHDKQRRGA